MKRRHPRTTRTYTLFPYSTLFRVACFFIANAAKPARCPCKIMRHGLPCRCAHRNDEWFKDSLDQGFKPSAAHQQRANHTSTDSEDRSEEHTSELQSLMRLSYAVFC